MAPLVLPRWRGRPRRRVGLATAAAAVGLVIGALRMHGPGSAASVDKGPVADAFDRFVWMFHAIFDGATAPAKAVGDVVPGKTKAAPRWATNGTVLQHGQELAGKRPRDDFPTSDQPDDENWLPAQVMPAMKTGSLDMAQDVVLVDKIEIDDIRQGGVGNCWLISGIAALAEFPDVIHGCFGGQKSLTQNGVYTCRIYDPTGRQGVSVQKVVVNDLVPCDRKPSYGGGSRWSFTPKYCRPNDNEIWTMVLEKACAKLEGGYEALNGGTTSYAWAMLMGPKGHSFASKEKQSFGNIWKIFDIAVFTSRTEFMGMPGPEMGDDNFFNHLLKLDSAGYVMGASQGNYAGTAGGEPMKKNGLIKGHAYSMVEVQEAAGERMLLLRNPWGDSHEWNGKWSDGSKEWNTVVGRAVAAALDYGEDKRLVGDGLFWMEWDDFIQEWDSVAYSKLQTGWLSGPKPRGRGH